MVMVLHALCRSFRFNDASWLLSASLYSSTFSDRLHRASIRNGIEYNLIYREAYVIAAISSISQSSFFIFRFAVVFAAVH